jgi:hypothetical protein
MPTLQSFPIAVPTSDWQVFKLDSALAQLLKAENPDVKFFEMEFCFTTEDQSINALATRKATISLLLGKHDQGLTNYDTSILPQFLAKRVSIGGDETASMMEINMRLPIMRSSSRDGDTHRCKVLITAPCLERFRNNLAGGVNQQSLQVHPRGAEALTKGTDKPLPGTALDSKLTKQLSIYWSWPAPLERFDDTWPVVSFIPGPDTAAYFLQRKHLGQIAGNIERTLPEGLKGLSRYEILKAKDSSVYVTRSTAEKAAAHAIRMHLEGTPLMISNAILHKNGTGESQFLAINDKREFAKLIAVADQKKNTPSPRTKTVECDAVLTAQKERRAIKVGLTADGRHQESKFTTALVVDHIVKHTDGVSNEDFHDVVQHSDLFATLCLSTNEKAIAALKCLNTNGSMVWGQLHLQSWADAAAAQTQADGQAEDRLLMEAASRSAEKRKQERLVEQKASRAKKQAARFQEVLKTTAGTPLMESWALAHKEEQAEVLVGAMEDFLDSQTSAGAASQSMFAEKFRTTAEDIEHADKWYDPPPHPPCP